MLPPSVGLLGALSFPIIHEAVGLVSHAVEVELLPKKYHINSVARNMMPDFASSFNAWKNGCLTNEGFKFLSAFQNISLNKDNGDVFQQTGGKAWNGIMESSLHQLDVEHIIIAYFKGLINLDKLNDLLKGYKFRNQHKDLVLQSLRGSLSPIETFALWNRGNFDDTRAKREIKRYGAIPDNLLDDISDLRKLCPTPSDLVSFLVRHVWEKDIRDDLGLDKEYDRVTKAEPWFNAVGIFNNHQIPNNEDNDPMDWIKAYWAVHWKAMSPEQGFIARQRLRPDRINRYQEIAPGVTPFGDKQLSQLLRMDDYAPLMRDWLKAISYRVIPQRQLKQLYFEEVIDLPEVVEQYQDQGYSPDDANNLAILLDKQKTEQEDSKVNNKLIQEISNAYQIGAIGRQAANDALLTTQLKSYEVTRLLNVIDIKINRIKVDAYIKMVRSEFELGLYTGMEARLALIEGGVFQSRADDYVQIWQRKLSRPRRVANTEKIISWYVKGMLSALDLLDRMTKLGWSNSDQLLYLAEANEKIEENTAKQQALLARSQRQAAEAAARIVRQQQAEIDHQISELNRHSSPSMMKAWFKEGLIDIATITDRLTRMRWPTDDITRYVDSLTL